MAALLEEDNDDKPDCPICGKYFAHPIFHGKCSRCSNNRGIATAPLVWYSEEFQRQLTEYVEQHTIDESSHFYSALKFHIERNNLEIAMEIVKEMTEQNLWITAKMAITFLRNMGRDTAKKSYLICYLILDWWNMTRDGFNSFELCYFGNYGEGGSQHVKSIPPVKIGGWNLKAIKGAWESIDKRGA